MTMPIIWKLHMHQGVVKLVSVFAHAAKLICCQRLNWQLRDLCCVPEPAITTQRQLFLLVQVLATNKLSCRCDHTFAFQPVGVQKK